MKVKNKTRLLNELAKSVETPWEFIEAIVSLEGLTIMQAVNKVGISAQQYYVFKNQRSIGVRTCLKFSEAFEINPTILNRVLADFNLKKILEEQSKETTNN